MMKYNLIRAYWLLIILLQSGLIYSKMQVEDSILWNIVALIGGIIFLSNSFLKKTRLTIYELPLAGFIGINGVTYALSVFIFKQWWQFGISIFFALISFGVMYLIFSISKKQN